MHIVLRIRFEIARGRLLYVLNTAERFGRFRLQLSQEVHQVADSRTLLVEIERIDVIGDFALAFRWRRSLMHADDAVQVPFVVVAIEFDLDVSDAVEADPLRQSLRKAVINAVFDVGRCDRVDGTDQVIQWQLRLCVRKYVAVEPFAAELGTQVIPEIVVQVIRSQSLIAALAV